MIPTKHPAQSLDHTKQSMKGILNRPQWIMLGMCWAREEPGWLSFFTQYVCPTPTPLCRCPISPTQTRSLNSSRAGACLLHSFMTTCIHRILHSRIINMQWMNEYTIPLLKILPRTLLMLTCKDINTKNWKAYPFYLWHLNSTLTLHHSDSLCTQT